MTFIVTVAILSSLFYGASDFLGALTARRLTVLKASAAVYFAATVAVATALAMSSWEFSVTALLAGLIAGVLATVGMVTFYAALALGPMSLLAPMIALVQTAVPVVVAAATGRTLAPIAWVAVGIALTATVVISLPAGVAVQRISLRAATLALVSALTLGLSLVALDTAPAASGVFPAFLDVGVGLIILLPLLALRRARVPVAWLDGGAGVEKAAGWPRRELVMSLAGGVLLGVGNVLLVIGLHSGNLAVVAVLVGLYPLGTVILAWVVLKERLTVMQLVGVGMAITAAAILGLS